MALLLRQCSGPRATQTPWVFAVCDVGQGDALFLADGPHTAIAVDTGPDPGREDACASRLGITDVPLVVLTHFHADHVDGLAGLLHGRRVGEIETTTVEDPPAGAAQVARLAAAARVPVVRVAPDERRSIGPVGWRVLWPQAEHPLSPSTGTGTGMGTGTGTGRARIRAPTTTPSSGPSPSRRPVRPARRSGSC
jgi:competence protein ComEC